MINNDAMFCIVLRLWHVCCESAHSVQVPRYLKDTIWKSPKTHLTIFSLTKHFTVRKNEWNHVVISHSATSNNLTIYINGSKMNDYDTSSYKLPPFDKMKFVLGKDLDVVSQVCFVPHPFDEFTGAIRGFNVWNKKLTDERVMDIFKGADEKHDMLITLSDFNFTDYVKKELFIP